MAAMRVDALYRGHMVTFEPRRPQASAIAVLDGRIVAVDDETNGLEPAETEDFGDGIIFPGFHDAHCHTTSYGIGLGELDLSTPPIRSLEELYSAVACHGKGLAPGLLVKGRGYDQNKLGGLHPELDRLDAAAGGHPVWLEHTSGHMCVVNSVALKLIGPAGLQAPIAGGTVQRDSTGSPTGLLQERAQSLVRHLFGHRSLEQIVAAIGAAHDHYLAEGLTSVCDAGIAGDSVGHSPIELAAYQLARDKGQLRVRSTVMISADLLHGVRANDGDGVELAVDAGARTGLGDEWLRIGPLKVFSDGSLIGRTCWMREAFADDPANFGYPQDDPDKLRRTIVAAHLAGWQVATHAIGDEAISFVLDCYDEALRVAPRSDHRHRIEHCGVTTAASLRRIAELGVIPVPQGRFVGEIGDGMMAALGPARAAMTYRLRSFIDAGIALPASSDRPVVDGQPLTGIEDMVTRRTESGRPFGSDEALSVEQALRAYTAGSAFAARCEHERGSLGVGKLADFVVLGADPRTVPATEIHCIPVLATAIGGHVAYRAG